MPHIGDFQAAARFDGNLRLNSPDQNQVKSPTSLGGRALAWIQSKTNPGRFHADNQQVMRAFIGALRAEYGEHFAEIASQRLGVDSGRPLSAREVRAFLAEGRAQKEATANVNQAKAEHVANDMDPGHPGSFGAMFEGIAARKGLTVPLDMIDVSKLQRKIVHEVTGRSGQLPPISDAEARSIAQRRIEKFIDNKVQLLASVSTLGVGNPAQEEFLKQFALRHEFTSPAFLKAAWEMRGDVDTLVGELTRDGATVGEKFSALNDFFQAYDGKLTTLIQTLPPEEVGGDDMLDFGSNSFELALTGPHGNNATLHTLFEKLGGQDLKDLRSFLGLAGSGVVDVSPRTMAVVQRSTDFLGLLTKLSGEATFQPEEQIAAQSGSAQTLQDLEDVRPDIILAARALGMGEFEQSLGRTLQGLSHADSRQRLGNALSNIQLTRELLEGGAADRETLSAHRALLVATKASIAAAAQDLVGNDTPARFEQVVDAQILSLLGKEQELVRELPNNQAINVLRQMEGDIVALRGQPSTNAALKTQLGESLARVRSELSVREDPAFGQLEGDPDQQQVMIGARYNTGKIIAEDLSVALKADVTPEARQGLADRKETAARGAHALRTTHGEGLTQFYHQRLDAQRMGTSQTVQGNSGLGNVQDGKQLAITNWQSAAQYADQVAFGDAPIGLDVLRELNRRLNAGLPANDGVPGEFRTLPETAGPGAQYPTPERIEPMMDEFMTWFGANQHRDPVELAALSYQKLISIHPFPDANGRTARLFADAILQRGGLPPATYTDQEVNVAMFGVPQATKPNPTPDDAVQSVMMAVERSLALLA